MHDVDNGVGAPCWGGGAIDVYNGNNVVVTGNRVANAGPAGCMYMHTIYVGGSNNYIANNVAYATSGWCIHLWPFANNTQVLSNQVSNCGSGGIILGGDGSSGTTDNNVIANNVVRNVVNFGIREVGSVGPHEQYANNDISGAKAAGAEVLGEPHDAMGGMRGYSARDLEGNLWSFGTDRPGR